MEWALEDYIKAKFGFEITYGTPGKKLIQDEAGRVTGVVGQKEDGSYVKYMADKAVILCTGGYEGNQDMMKKYLPDYDRYIVKVGKQTNTGDGLLMAQWAGAQIDPWPHMPMTWDGMNPEAIQLGLDYVGVARQAWLYVNAFGQRFMNEDCVFASQGKAVAVQPRSMMWTIFDEKWRDDDVEVTLKGTVCRRMTTRYYYDPDTEGGLMPYCTPETTESMIEAGVILKADSLDELVELMNEKGPELGIGSDLDKNIFLATVKRYNEICDAGYDYDFGKDPICLHKIDQPPYYACRTGCGILVTQSGAICDEHMRVVDKMGMPIPGLYAAGNVAGGFGSYEFSMDTNLGSLGRAATTGWILPYQNTGEGMMAGIWAGGVKDENVTSMLFDRGGIAPGAETGFPEQGSLFWMGSQPFLKVDLTGKRIGNENVPYDSMIASASTRKGNLWCSIWDANYMQNVEVFHTLGCSRILPSPTPRAYSFGPENIIGMNMGLQEAGIIFQCNTLEELAEKLGIPSDTFTETVESYNQLCDTGGDTQLGKDAKDMIALATPPYSGCRVGSALLCTLDGLLIDENCHVLDENEQIIEGLWAAGNVSGGFFAGCYPDLVPGVACGRSATEARHAVLNMMGIK